MPYIHYPHYWKCRFSPSTDKLVSQRPSLNVWGSKSNRCRRSSCPQHQVASYHRIPIRTLVSELDPAMCNQHLPGTRYINTLMRSSNTAQAVSRHSASELSLVMSCSSIDPARGRGACGPIHIHLLFHHAPATRPASFFLDPGWLHLKAAFPKREATPIHPHHPQTTLAHASYQKPSLSLLSHLQNICRFDFQNLFSIVAPQATGDIISEKHLATSISRTSGDFISKRLGRSSLQKKKSGDNPSPKDLAIFSKNQATFYLQKTWRPRLDSSNSTQTYSMTHHGVPGEPKPTRNGTACRQANKKQETKKHPAKTPPAPPSRPPST